ncbi:MAG TPA: BrnA antitoxin family protein [Roseiarcus sp.]|nr:BrnA antitoxin family protein [Roseiarcus sp.]
MARKSADQIAISVSLSRDVVDAFKAKGPGWQSRIDETLRASLRETG